MGLNPQPMRSDTISGYYWYKIELEDIELVFAAELIDYLMFEDTSGIRSML